MSLETQPDQARGTRWTFLFLTAIALAWGIRFEARALLAAGLASAGTLVALALYPRLAARGVVVVRKMRGAAFEDDEVEVSFGVENRGRLPLVFPQVEDLFPPEQDVFRRAALPDLVPGRSRSVGRYRATCYTKRGGYEIGPGNLRVACPLGLFPVFVTLGARERLVVFPRVDPLPPLPGGGRGLPIATTARSLVAGQGAEALSVREYRPGDPLRRIHWPTTARRGKLAVLELELEHGRDVALFLDLDRRTLRGLGRRSTLEYSVRIVASAAAAYLRRGDRVRVVARGKEPFRIPPGTGELHLARILEELAHVRPDGETALETVIEDAASELAPGSTAFVVLPAADADVRAEARTAAVAALRARGCSVVAVLLDEGSFLAIYREQQKGRLREDLPRAADALAAEGALVYAVAQGDDLATRFATPFGGFSARRIGVGRRA